MMKKFQIEIKYAVVYSLAQIIWAAGEKAVGLHDRHIDQQLMYTNLFGMIGLAIYYIAVREKKLKYFGGKMIWAQGFVSGVFLATFSAVLSPAYIVVIYKAVSPQYFENMIRYVKTHDLPAKNNAELFFSLKSYMLQSSLAGISFGILAAAIVAFILKTKTRHD